MTDVELQTKTLVKWVVTYNNIYNNTLSWSWTTTLSPSDLERYDDVYDWIGRAIDKWRSRQLILANFRKDGKGAAVPWEKVVQINFTVETVEPD